MILEKLCEYAERIEDFPPLHFQNKSVDWILELDKAGNFKGIIDVSDEGDIFLYSKNLVGRSGRAVRPLVVGDKAKYIFGRLDSEDLSNREEKLKNSFYELLYDCYRETDDKNIKAIIDFLDENKFYELNITEEVDINDWLLFRIDGESPLESQVIQKYWQSRQNEVAKDRTDMISECMICGEYNAIADRHTEKLKLSRIGGHGRGNPLISANVESFESYGLKESRIAPVCYDCATNYGRAANYLLDKKSNNIKIGDLIYLFWTKENQEFNISSLFDDPQPEEVSTYISSFYKGVPTDIKSDEFYVLALSANNSRAVVRDWIQTTLFEVKQNIANYFVSMELEDYKDRKFYPINSLASQTAKDFDDIKPIVSESLMSYALKGTPLPSVVLVNTVNRIKADVEYRVTKPRAAIIKMYFHSNSKGGFKVEKKLNKNIDNPAYLCGRLFSVIEIIQKKALPGITSTIVDKYYGTASAAPASVFGNLLRKAQHHLAKLRKDDSTRGLYHWLDKELQDIMVNIEDFPASLSLQDQALFALGYYQQKAYKNEKEDK